MLEQKIYWSNCLIEGLRQKIKDPANITLKFLFFGLHFHVMWLDKWNHVVRHFTHKYFDGKCCDLFFKGQIESMSIEKFNNFCQKKNINKLMIKI